jgi:segregation and condensation protein B
LPTSGSRGSTPPLPETSGLLPVLEALLFASPQPLTITGLREVLEEIGEEEMRALLLELKAGLEASGRGVTLVEVAGGWQIVSRREYAPYVQKMLRGRRKARLSRAALETLAIVAYRQPVTKSDIEAIRGVDSSGVLAHLLERNLVGIRGRARALGRPLLYGTMQEFLVYFGLNDLSELPRPEELAALLKERDSQIEMDLLEEGGSAGADPSETLPESEEPAADLGSMDDSELDPEAWEDEPGEPRGTPDGDPPR